MISMREIAALAGVSRTTVSFVLNGRYQDMKISSEVVQRVREISQKYGYVPNKSVQSMVTGKSKVIAVISKFHTFSFWFLQGISESAAEHGYSLQLIPWNDKNTLNQGILQAFSYRVAGIIITYEGENEDIEIDNNLLQYGIPILGLEPRVGITFNQIKSAEIAVEYLTGLGHRKIFCLANRGLISQHREQGYCNVMNRQGLIVNILRTSALNDADAFNALLEAKPDAVFCVNDNLALYLMQFLHEKKLYVPDVFSLIGFGNQLAGEMSSPGLTTISEPYYETGQRAFATLLSKMENKEEKNLAPLIGKLIERKSAARKLV